jgi:hypothetical protein
MTIRFLQTVQSENPAFPFMAGQVIHVPAPSPFLLGLVDGVRAEAVKTDSVERAVVDELETPEPVLVKRGRKRVRA